MAIKYTVEEISYDIFSIYDRFPTRVDKPWGAYFVHHETIDKSVCVKTLIINPGHQLSLQYHNRRSELWYIDEDNSLYELTIDGTPSIHMGKRSVHIPMNSVHCVRNMSSIPLVIHETQYGYCDDDDIVRVSDPYKDQR